MRPTARYQANQAQYSVLLRLCGIGAVAAGLLFVVWGYVDRPLVFGYREIAVSVLSFAVPALFLVGLIGVYLWGRGRVGLIGNAGLVLGFIGSGLGVLLGLAHINSWYGHWLLFLWDAAWLPTLLAGLTLAGMALAGTRRLRDLGVVSLMTGVLGWAYYVTEAVGIVETRLGHVVFGLGFSLSWMVLGLALLRRGATRKESRG